MSTEAGQCRALRWEVTGWGVAKGPWCTECSLQMLDRVGPGGRKSMGGGHVKRSCTPS